MKTFLLRYWKIQFISTQKNLLTFSVNVWLTEGFPTHWKEQMLLRFLKTVSMLSSFSKVFKKLLFEQINDHMQSKSSKHLAGFRKNHSTKNALLVMNEKRKTILKKKTHSGCFFYGFVKSVWYLRSLSIVGQIKCIWFW